MGKPRSEELFARDCIGGALRVEVRVHDDGSQPGMHDLDINYPHGSPAAVEVTGVGDASMIELWNLLNGGDQWIDPGLVGGWNVEVSPQARVKRLRSELPTLLAHLEATGIDRIRPSPESRRMEERQAHDLGVTRLDQYGTDRPGSIYTVPDLPDDRSGGAVADTGDALAAWVGPWLTRPEQAHNLDKLMRSGSDERHMFLILPGLDDADFSVTYVLMRDGMGLPTQHPDLPTEVTHLWAVSLWSSGKGMRWSPSGGWAYFDKPVEAGRKDAADGSRQ